MRSPHAAASWAPLDERDIAAVATRALLTDELLGSRPELTAPVQQQDYRGDSAAG